MLNMAVRKAAASEGGETYFRSPYVEPLGDARTQLAAIFSILLLVLAVEFLHHLLRHIQPRLVIDHDSDHPSFPLSMTAMYPSFCATTCAASWTFFMYSATVSRCFCWISRLKSARRR